MADMTTGADVATESLEERHLRRKRMHRNAKTGTDDASQVTEADYLVSGPLRYVLPYPFTFKVNVKRRWVNKPFLEVFEKEFPHFDWRRECSLGNVTINSRKKPLREPERLTLRDGDWIDHRVHRHESPVHKFDTIPILHNGDDLIAISKPASVPIHPCGSFRKNSLTYLLRLQHGLRDLFGIHRIDRQTSGLVIFAKNKEVAKRVAEEIRENRVQKEYLALVHGCFPAEQVVCNDALKFDPVSKRGTCCESEGKPARTDFNRIWVDLENKTSLVRCQPKTGRTHQIRLHLEKLGFPILNDPKYGACSKLVQEDEQTKFQHPALP
eukprot:Plantae.Rhodophyta-Rhodochaete_pulchella.ctg2919.p1 GENE.Plantae.Rhodophyta-Rhodochaete_pulchella.ctg2919~~Plantae.Rhodophyta-Rhodochaete_pulchella.ctg2919.p1  ORF type:complete len:325 (-),score=40.40 Plantae.Rhodophyta-Rhodochaete_pulchella.ctg2919:934-1908(-)